MLFRSRESLAHCAFSLLHRNTLNFIKDRNGAGFSDVGMTAVRRALADVGEAPRHEVAGDVGRGCAGLYGDLPIAPVLAMIAGGAPVARLGARSGADRAVFEA